MLILARHGQSEANAGGLLVGRADSPLTDLGVRQAEAIGVALAGARPISRLITSPLARAAETAARIAAVRRPCAPLVEVDERLTELDYGELDLLPAGRVEPSVWSAWRSDTTYRPAGGETLAELSLRTTSLLDELVPRFASAGSSEDAVLVSHVSPIKAIIAAALGTGVEISWRMSLSVASISRLGPGPGGGLVLHSFNETWHLTGL